jgi:ribosomal protein S27E
LVEVTTVKCKNCGELLTDPPDGPRVPCPNCGSTAREFAASASIVATSSISAEGEVERGVNEARAAVLFLLLAIGLTVGFGAPWIWWARLIGSVVAVVASAVFVAVALRYPPVRRRVMSLMHMLTGQ